MVYSLLLLVFSVNEVNAFNMERTITIRGTMENIEMAEKLISAKLRQSFEYDMMNAVSLFGFGFNFS